MRWLTISEVAVHMHGVADQTLRDWIAAGELDGVVTKSRGSQIRLHPESSWFHACHGRAATSLDEAYEWAETHPLPEIPRNRGAVLVEATS